MHDFIRVLAVCHTVMVEKDPKEENELLYTAASPDELALVKFAKEIGVVFSDRTSSHIKIILKGEEQIEEDYEILIEFPFDSFRKRMSLLVSNHDGKYILMTKGADSVMLPPRVKELETEE